MAAFTFQAVTDHLKKWMVLFRQPACWEERSRYKQNVPALCGKCHLHHGTQHSVMRSNEIKCCIFIREDGANSRKGRCWPWENFSPGPFAIQIGRRTDKDEKLGVLCPKGSAKGWHSKNWDTLFREVGENQWKVMNSLGPVSKGSQLGHSHGRHSAWTF